MTPGTRERWPADRFLWAVLEASGWHKSGALPAGLMLELADEIPIPVEQVHAVGVPLADDRLLVCSAKRTELRALAGSVTSLTPEALPTCVSEDVDSESLELLVGTFEPRAVRRSRHRLHMVAMAAVLVCAGLLAIGSLRRAVHSMDNADFIRTSRLAMVSQASLTADPTVLAQEVRQLESDVTVASIPRPRDAALTLVALLSTWPSGFAADPLSLSLSHDRVIVSVSLDGDASTFLSAFEVPEGWLLEDPQLSTAAGLTHLLLHLRPQEGVQQ